MSDGASDEFEQPKIAPVFLGEFEFSSGTVRFFTGIGQMVWDGKTWYGAGALARVGELEETADGRAVGTQVELTGVPLTMEVEGVQIDILQIAINEEWQQRPARIFYGLLNPDLTWAAQPFQVRKQMMDVMELSEDGKSSRIILNLESPHFDNERAEISRWTAEGQRALHPGDAFWDQEAALQGKPITWTLGT
jgi:hypothetical protein